MPALLPAIGLALGVACGIAVAPVVRPFDVAGLMALLALATAAAAYAAGCPRTVVVSTGIGTVACGFALGTYAATEALRTPLRAAVNHVVPGFPVGSRLWGVLERPVTLEGTLRDDAVVEANGVGLSIEVESVDGVTDGGGPVAVSGGVRAAVYGEIARRHALRWTAGRRIRAPVRLRRPATYWDEGVPDRERQLAWRGVTLLGAIKSGALVEIVAPGGWWQERAASARAWARRVIAGRASAAGPAAAGIVAAILIGDRAGLSRPVRDRLQRAGTYHVIAISGGNIALLVATLVGALALLSLTGRVATALALVGVIAYASVVSGGASVTRATVMAAMYLGARLLDHRSPPLNAAAFAVTMMLAANPLDLVDAGFGLTVGATAGILLVADRWQCRLPRRRWLRVPAALLLASLAAEAALLPLSAATFSRVTIAGLLLNFVAIPLMGLAQVAGLATLLAAAVPAVSATTGAVASWAAAGLVDSASLVDAWPWMAWRVPAPPAWLSALYCAAGVIAFVGSWRWSDADAWRRWTGRSAVALATMAGFAIAAGVPAAGARPIAGALRVTVLDVGQGDATLVQFPDGRSMLVDTGGGSTAGPGLGASVVAPSLWARGVRRLDWLVLTHGDPDHIGGAMAVVEDFRPAVIWEGVPVEAYAPLRDVKTRAAELGLQWQRMAAGAALEIGGVRVDVLHPPPAEWERMDVRNDDSVVLELRHGDVSVVLPGDAEREAERRLVSRLSPAPVRILKMGHHGSRTSSAPWFVAALHPRVAIASAGRGNRFGHPAVQVVARYEAAGASVWRTDHDGEITLETDGRIVRLRSFTGRTEVLAAGH